MNNILIFAARTIDCECGVSWQMLCFYGKKLVTWICFKSNFTLAKLLQF